MNRTALSLTQKAFIASASINMFTIVMCLFLLPAKTAIHFNGHGLADRWGSRTVFVVINLVLVALTYISIEYGAKVILKFPKPLISLPNKDYWLAPENRARTEALFTCFLRYFGVLNYLFQSALLVLTIHAHYLTPVRLNSVMMGGLTLGFLATIAVWCGFLIRAFKVPAHEDDALHLNKMP